MKAKIQETQGDDFPAASLNVIYQGKVQRGRGDRAVADRAPAMLPVAGTCAPDQSPSWALFRRPADPQG